MGQTGFVPDTELLPATVTWVFILEEQHCFHTKCWRFPCRQRDAFLAMHKKIFSLQRVNSVGMEVIFCRVMFCHPLINEAVSSSSGRRLVFSWQAFRAGSLECSSAGSVLFQCWFQLTLALHLAVSVHSVWRVFRLHSCCTDRFIMEYNSLCGIQKLY